LSRPRRAHLRLVDPRREQVDAASMDLVNEVRACCIRHELTVGEMSTLLRKIADDWQACAEGRR
jgi:hypothetical protein